MKVEIANGASVHRCYSESVELLAVFQYIGDAEAFANLQLTRDGERGWFGSSYAIFNSYDASLSFVRPSPTQTQEAA